MVRGSLGAIKLLGEEGVHHRYPMYVIKVTDLLELDHWKPHQDLVKAGKMTVQMWWTGSISCAGG